MPQPRGCAVADKVNPKLCFLDAENPRVKVQNYTVFCGSGAEARRHKLFGAAGDD